MSSSQLTVGRVQTYGFDIVANGIVKILPEAALQGPGTDAGFEAKIFHAYGSLVVLVDVRLGPPGDVPSRVGCMKVHGSRPSVSSISSFSSADPNVIVRSGGRSDAN